MKKTLLATLLGISCIAFAATSFAQTPAKPATEHKKLFGVIAPGYSTIKDVKNKLKNCSRGGSEGNVSLLDITSCFDIGLRADDMMLVLAQDSVVTNLAIAADRAFLEKNFINNSKAFQIPEDYIPSFYSNMAKVTKSNLDGKYSFLVGLSSTAGANNKIREQINIVQKAQKHAAALETRQPFYGKENIFALASRSFDEMLMGEKLVGTYYRDDWVFFYFDTGKHGELIIQTKDLVERERQAFKTEEKKYFKAQEEKAKASENTLKNML